MLTAEEVGGNFSLNSGFRALIGKKFDERQHTSTVKESWKSNAGVLKRVKINKWTISGSLTK